MSQFTYENTDKQEKLETYEWDNVWIDHAEAPELTRVLYIGDSISCGTLRVATAESGERIHFDGFGTSKALDNPYFKDALRIFGKQQGRRDAILFNNGLHGWHLNDKNEYRILYEEMVLFLLREFPDTPLYIVLTTHVRDTERDKRVVIRNQGAKMIAEKYGLPVIDFYDVSLRNEEALTADGVHFQPNGYKLLANTILSGIPLRQE